MPQLLPIIAMLLQKITSPDADPLIQHIPYKTIIHALGGSETFTQMAFNTIDERVASLEGKVITVHLLDEIRVSQSQQQNTWPRHNGGYLNYVTDDRDKDYWRGYVGQASNLGQRVSQHCRAIQKGDDSTLHYYAITKKSHAGNRQGNFIQLWSIEFPGDTDESTREAFGNILEMTFARAFQTLPHSILEEYFGLCPEGAYSNVGLNVISPLLQGRELAPAMRGTFCKLLENSPDPDIREWPGLRAQQRMVRKACALTLRIHPRMTEEENYTALREAIEKNPRLEKTLMWRRCDEIPWAPHGGEQTPMDVSTWFSSVSDWLLGQNIFIKTELVSPVGTAEASVGIILDSAPAHSYEDQVYLPYGLRESGFSESNSLIWTFNCQKYKLIPGSFQVSPLRDVDTEILSRYTRDLVCNSRLRVILLCGKKAEAVALSKGIYFEELTLILQGIEYRAWLEIKDHAIERIFLKSPAPLSKLWSNKGSKAVKINALFRFVSSITNLNLTPGFYQAALTTALIVRGWDDERAGRIKKLSGELDNIDPILRAWLEKLGFTTDEDIHCLAKLAWGSLRYGFLVLSLILPRQPRPHCGHRIPESRERRRDVVPKDVLEDVRTLFHECQARLDASHCEIASEEIDIVEDEALLVALARGVAIGEHDPEIDQAIRQRQGAIYKRSAEQARAFRKNLQLTIGHAFRGSEVSPEKYQINVQHVTFRVHARPNHTWFHVKAELSPVGQRHPRVFATAASDDDPGVRFALRICIKEDDGVETSVQYPCSNTWKSIAIANSFVDGLAGDTLEDICRRPRRYVFVDARSQNLCPELAPFVGGAYIDDDGSVGRRAKKSQFE